MKPRSISHSFDDFTRLNYRRLLNLAKNNYEFRTFDNFSDSSSYVIWRHDVDSSIQSAHKLALIEAEEGVQTYYFIHLHNVLYNPLEKKMSEIIREIMKCGHKIGLHFETAYYDLQDEIPMEKWLRFEADILEHFFCTRITAFSFHNPTELALKCTKSTYAGLINATSEYFRTKVGYCSDSNGYWRHRRLEDVLAEATDERIQVLTHPEWWQETVMSPKERIWRCIDGRAANTKHWYENILTSFDRQNVDWNK
jgi:hypothetical protein